MLHSLLILLLLHLGGFLLMIGATTTPGFGDGFWHFSGEHDVTGSNSVLYIYDFMCSVIVVVVAGTV